MTPSYTITRKVCFTFLLHIVMIVPNSRARRRGIREGRWIEECRVWKKLGGGGGECRLVGNCATQLIVNCNFCHNQSCQITCARGLILRGLIIYIPRCKIDLFIYTCWSFIELRNKKRKHHIFTLPSLQHSNSWMSYFYLR